MTEQYIRPMLIALIVIVGIALLVGIIMALAHYLRVFAANHLTYKRYFSCEGAFENDKIYLIEEFSNRTFLPMFNVEIESHVPSGLYLTGSKARDLVNQDFVSTFYVMPYTKIVRKHEVIAKKRGYYRLETAQISFRELDIFLKSEAEFYVYPREIGSEKDNEKNRYIQYSDISLRPLLLDVFSFSGIREYVSGDSMGSINFKASSRMNKLMVNNYDYICGKLIKIYLNFQMEKVYKSLEEETIALENSLSYVSFLMGYAIKRGYKVGFMANCRMVNGDRYISYPIDTGEAHYKELLKQLAMANPIYGNSFVSLMDMDLDKGIQDTQVYIFTAVMDDEIEKRIDTLKMYNNDITIIDIKEIENKEEQD